MTIGSENAGKLTMEGKFPYAVCRKGADKIQYHASFAGAGCIRDVVILEVNRKRINTKEDFPGRDLTDHFIEIMEKL